MKPPSNYSMRQIQFQLKPDEVVVDFVRSSAPGLFESTTVYVFGRSGEPVAIDFGSGGLVSPEETLGIMRKMAAKHGSVEEKGFDEMARFAWKKLWVSIDSAITKIVDQPSTVYVIPIRSIAASPLATLKDNRGKLLYENYDLAYLTVVQDLISRRESKEQEKVQIIGVGGVDYGKRGSDFFSEQRNVMPIVGDFVTTVVPKREIYPAEIEFTTLSRAHSKRAF